MYVQQGPNSSPRGSVLLPGFLSYSQTSLLPGGTQNPAGIWPPKTVAVLLVSVYSYDDKADKGLKTFHQSV